MSRDAMPRARGMASRLMEEANGYNTEVTQKAEGDASRFKSVLGEYAKAPGVTRDRLYIDMMQSVLGNSSKVLIDQKAGGNLLYLPLDKLLQGNAAAAAAAVAADTQATAPRPGAATAPEPAAPVDSGRSRDAMRNRER
jgi:membrane protease subunit HflK